MPVSSEQLPHLLILDRVESREFRREGRGRNRIRKVDRQIHGRRILSETSDALAEQDNKRLRVDIEELQSTGVIVTIEGAMPTDDAPEASRFPLRLESLDQMSRHRKAPRPKWILLSVTQATERTPERAQVWISDEYRSAFLKLFERYLHEENARSGRPKNRALVANISRVRSAVLHDLWQSHDEPPTSGLRWWEIWLRPEPNAIRLATDFAHQLSLRLATRHLRLNNRHIVWIRCRWFDLQALVVSAVPVTEIRRPQFVDTIEDLDPPEQEEYVRDLAERLLPALDEAPAVCLLDTGVRRTHGLLQGSLATPDMHTVVGEPSADRHGHGTLMAGLALFGPLDRPLLETGPVRLLHRLESVKYLPDRGSRPHDPEAYGVITAEAVSLPEITDPRRRVYSLTITTEGGGLGEPSLWSAAVDALSVGTDVGRSPAGIDLLGPPQPGAQRLVIVSAGNVDPPYQSNYRDKCDLSPIEDPSQAWNALTVGAYTQLDSPPSDPSFEGWTPVATPGDVSPHSRTGLLAGDARWPIKPDICMEGGNVIMDGRGDFIGDHPVLSLASTSNRSDTALGSASMTSAATAQAARIAARAMASYPDYWPETIRGLLTHAAEWTPLMRDQVLAATSMTSRAQLLRRYGWGVPTTNRSRLPPTTPSPWSSKTSSRHSPEGNTPCDTSDSINCHGRQVSSANSGRPTLNSGSRCPISSNHPRPGEAGAGGTRTRRMASVSSCARPARQRQSSSVV